MKITISTGKIYGRGCDPYKWVSGLSREERETVKRQTRREVFRAFLVTGIPVLRPDGYGYVYEPMTSEQRDVASGEDEYVVIDCRPSLHYTQSGWKVVRYMAGRYTHREPSEDLLAAIVAHTRKQVISRRYYPVYHGRKNTRYSYRSYYVGSPLISSSDIIVGTCDSSVPNGWVRGVRSGLPARTSAALRHVIGFIHH
jgi:hypothetical protein